MSLPKEQGGIGLVDVEAFVTALQAKVAARAPHPAPALWKVMFFFHLGYMGFALNNLPDPNAMRLRAFF
jgi:hypothetical protein